MFCVTTVNWLIVLWLYTSANSAWFHVESHGYRAAQHALTLDFHALRLWSCVLLSFKDDLFFFFHFGIWTKDFFAYSFPDLAVYNAQWRLGNLTAPIFLTCGLWNNLGNKKIYSTRLPSPYVAKKWIHKRQANLWPISHYLNFPDLHVEIQAPFAFKLFGFLPEQSGRKSKE